MRPTLFVVLSTFLAVASGGNCPAEQSPSWWWPFDDGDQNAQSSTPPAAASQPQPPEAGAPDWWTPTMPKFKWPSTSAPSGPHSEPRDRRARTAARGRPATNRQRNAWAKSRTERAEAPTSDSPWKVVSDGAQRISDSTRDAWHKTVDAFTPAKPADARAAQREPKLSWWSRLWGADDPKSEGPRTVTEWMAQERLDP